MSAGCNVHARPAEAMRALLGEATLEASRERPWHSATVSGARHRFVFHRKGMKALQGFVAIIGEYQLVTPGHVVANFHADVSDADSVVTVEALTVEEF